MEGEGSRQRGRWGGPRVEGGVDHWKFCKGPVCGDAVGVEGLEGPGRADNQKTGRI